MGGSVFTVAGGKGGVGKTTVTANVGVALASEGFDVAAVDADVGMTNLGRMLGVEPERGIHDVLADRASVAEVTRTGPEGLEVVPGEAGLPPTEAADPANLKRAVRPLQRSADIVLVDTGAGVSHQNLVAAGLADGVLLVTTAASTAITDTGKAADLVDRVETPVLGSVLTRASDDADVERIVEELDAQVLAAVPGYPEPPVGEPRVLEAPESPAAAAYERLATTLAVCHESGHLDTSAARDGEAAPIPAEAPVATVAGDGGLAIDAGAAEAGAGVAAATAASERSEATAASEGSEAAEETAATDGGGPTEAGVEDGDAAQDGHDGGFVAGLLGRLGLR